MLYREIIAVCSQIHTKHINTLCGQNVELLNVNLLAVYCSIVSSFSKVKRPIISRWTSRLAGRHVPLTSR